MSRRALQPSQALPDRDLPPSSTLPPPRPRAVSDAFAFPEESVSFKFKMDTDLYALARAKTIPTSVTFSPDGANFVVTASDARVRVFRFRSGKLSRE